MTGPPDAPRDCGGEDDALRALLLPCTDCKAGPARRRPLATSAQVCRSAVDEALRRRRAASAAESPRVDPRGPVRAARPTPSVRSWLYRAVVAAALLLASSVGVGALTMRLVDFWPGSAEEAPPPDPKPRPAARPAPAPAPLPEPPALEVEVPRASRTAPAPAPVRRGHRQRPRDDTDADVARSRPDAALPVPPDLPPEDLLLLASERRRGREWRAADAFYAAVVSRFPDSDAAVVAQIASAALHLRLDDAPGALAAFHHALGARPQGPLAEDARWGIAEAQRALGDTRSEAEALRAFLDRHPRSALAPAARRRLEGLAP